jgi:hypothetical protein
MQGFDRGSLIPKNQLPLFPDVLHTARPTSWSNEWMRNSRPALFRGKHFSDEIIVLCVRWYLFFLRRLDGFVQIKIKEDPEA